MKGLHVKLKVILKLYNVHFCTLYRVGFHHKPVLSARIHGLPVNDITHKLHD